MNLINSLHQVVKQKLWKEAVHYTQELLKEGKVVDWQLIQTASARYAEWQAGEPMKWKTFELTRIEWKVMSVPTVARRLGNSWTGGEQSVIDQGSSVIVTSEQAARFIETIKLLDS